MDVVDGCYCSNCGAARPEEPGPCALCGDTRRSFHANISAEVKVTASMSAGVRRGPQSWAYFYMVGAVLLAIGLAIIALLPVPWWARVIWMLCFAIFVIVAIADSRRVHELLLSIKAAYEDKLR